MLHYGLTEKDLELERISLQDWKNGVLSYERLMEDFKNFEITEEEFQRIFVMAFRLTAARGPQWVNEAPGRMMADFIVMALDTAMVWERG